jgi:hypothetical protein
VRLSDSRNIKTAALEVAMFPFTRRRVVDAGVRFCEECAEVTTAAQRADRLRERVRGQALAWTRLH